MRPEAKKKAVYLLNRGFPLTWSIITAVYETWPCDGVVPHCGDKRHDELCGWCAQYNKDAPEVAALEDFRAMVGTRRLDEWFEEQWASDKGGDGILAAERVLGVRS